jgi:MoxR-like ATPase
MHPLMRVVRQVDRTHPGLGQLVAVAVLSVLARRTLLIVGPAGTGKSTVGQALRAQGWPVLPLDQLTAASL